MAKAKAESAAVSFDPDTMSSGLKDDFRGKITNAVYGPWDYDGNIDEPVLGVRLTIAVEDEDEPVVQWWSAGDLAAFAPSQDGVEPCEQGEVGPYAVKVGKRTALSGSTNFASLMKAVIDAGAASGKFERSSLTNSLECLEGIDAHWNRVPQQKRSGMAGQGEGQKGKDVLVVTEIYGYGEEVVKKGGAGKAAPVKPAPKGKAAAEAEEPEQDLDEQLSEIIIEALGDGNLKKAKLPALILGKMGKSPNKAAAVQRVTKADFLEGGAWTYDAASGTLSLE